MRLAQWRRIEAGAGLAHAAHAVYERDDIAARAYLVWDADIGWLLSVRIEPDGQPPREAGRILLSGPDCPMPTIGDVIFGFADDTAERATR